MSRTVSICCNEAVVIRGKDERGATNWYECVKCGKPCDVKSNECEIDLASSRSCDLGTKGCIIEHKQEITE